MPGCKITALAVGDVDGDGKNELLAGMKIAGKNVIRIYDVHSSSDPFDGWTVKSEIRLPDHQEVRGLAVFAPQ